MKPTLPAQIPRTGVFATVRSGAKAQLDPKGFRRVD
jgi:hypothetical protein